MTRNTETRADPERVKNDKKVRADLKTCYERSGNL